MGLQPPLYPIFRDTQLLQNALSAVHGCSQLGIYPLRNVAVQIPPLHHQLDNGLGILLICLFRAVVAHFLALLHMIGIHKHQLYPLGLDIVSKRESVMTDWLTAYQ